MSWRVNRFASALYAVAFEVLVWSVLTPLELARVVLGRSTVADLAERLAWNAVPPKRSRYRLLVHAVSAGEMSAAGALVEALSDVLPSSTVLLSSHTTTGRRVARDLERLPAVESAVLLPWDRRAALRAWFARLEVDAVVFVETEIWPGAYLACADLGRPLVIVSGRLAAHDIWRYRLARPVFAAALETARWVGVQDVPRQAAFRRIGSPAARTEVIGDLKADAAMRPVDPLPPEWQQSLAGGRPLLVAGSTHAPEERLLVAAFARLRVNWPLLRLVVAPRRVGRTRTLARRLAQPGLRVARWSRGPRPSDDWDILLVDRFGPLRALYRFADIAFIGGTMSRAGGHNVLEAAAAGCAIIVGTNVEDIRSTVDGLDASNAVRRVSGDGDCVARLHDTIEALLANPEVRIGLGRRAKAYVEAQGGVGRRYATRIATVLSPEPQPAPTRRSAR